MDRLLDLPSEISAFDFTEDDSEIIWLRATMQYFVAMLNEDKRESMGITRAHLEILDIKQPLQLRWTKPKVLPLHHDVLFRQLQLYLRLT
jgi:hypothetical protein